MKKTMIIARGYLVVWKLFQKLISLIKSIFTGFWLGVLNEKTLHLIDEIHYSTTGKTYKDDDYNRSGFWKWEEKAINKFFQKSSPILVTAAGGGREVLALKKLGFDVDGFECHPGLRDNANRLLEKEGFHLYIQNVERDKCPNCSRVYGGVIIGWTSYMCIQGKEKRAAFLREIRKTMRNGSPILLSFWARQSSPFRFRVITMTGNFIRKCLFKKPLDIGDDLFPFFVHYFSEDEIDNELNESGFSLKYFSKEGYGHAVGIAT